MDHASHLRKGISKGLRSYPANSTDFPGFIWFVKYFDFLGDFTSLQLLCFMQLGFIVRDRPCWRNRVWLFEHFMARGLLSFLFLFDILHCFRCFTIFLFLFCYF